MSKLNIEDKLRRATRGQLLALSVVADSPDSLATTSEIQEKLYSQIDDCTATANQSVGGTISAVSRIKTDEQSLLIPMGRTENDGIRWQLNENIIKKEELREIVNDILSSWR